MKKAYIVNYGIKNGCRIDGDTAIVFAENETEAKSVMRNYVRSFNKNARIWISDTESIPMDSKYELDSIYSVEEFTGSVFTRLFEKMIME